MINSAKFHIIYDGPALENNDMDVRDLAPSLLAFADAIDETNKILNGNRSKVVIKVNASFKTGCFGVDLSTAQSITDSLINLFKDDNVIAATALLSFLGFTVKDGIVGLINVIKWISGRKISNIEVVNDKNAKIYIDDDSLEVEREAIELLRSYKLRESIEKAIVTPLERDGIDSVSTTDDINNTAGIITIKKDDRLYYKAPEKEEENIEDVEYETNLQIVNVVFQEKNKWRFTE